MNRAGEGGQRRLGYPQQIRQVLVSKGSELLIFEGNKSRQICIYLHINCVNSRPGHALRALESPWLLLPPLWFPHLSEGVLVPVVWPQLGKGRSDVGHWLPQDQQKAFKPTPGPHRLTPVGTLDAAPETVWKAPGWLRASHRSAFPSRDPL